MGTAGHPLDASLRKEDAPWTWCTSISRTGMDGDL